MAGQGDEAGIAGRFWKGRAQQNEDDALIPHRPGLPSDDERERQDDGGAGTRAVSPKHGEAMLAALRQRRQRLLRATAAPWACRMLPDDLPAAFRACAEAGAGDTSGHGVASCRPASILTESYAKVCTITGPATAVAASVSRGVRFCSIHASPRLLDSSAPA